MKKALKILLCSLVLIGALNWGLVGVFKFDLVAFLFGEMTVISRAIYTLVGVSAILSALCYWIFGGCDNQTCDC